LEFKILGLNSSKSVIKIFKLIIFMTLIGDWLVYDDELFLFPLSVSESSNTLIIASKQERNDHRDQQAILYNWRDNRSEQIRSTNIISWFCTNDYVESLVSTY
jgi:hypothetical protein